MVPGNGLREGGRFLRHAKRGLMEIFRLVSNRYGAPLCSIG